MLVLSLTSINRPANTPQPMASTQIYQSCSKHCTLGILNWMLGYSTVGLLQHFRDSILHWQELTYQSNKKSSKLQPFWKGQAPTSKMQCLFKGEDPSFMLALETYWLTSSQSCHCDVSSSYIRTTQFSEITFHQKNSQCLAFWGSQCFSILSTIWNVTEDLDISTSLLQLFSYNIICT